MTVMPAPTFIVYRGGAALADGLTEDRCIRTKEARDALPAGTITIDADECYAVADGRGGFLAPGLEGTFPGHESVVLPAYLIAGPDIPPLIPGGGIELVSQDEVDRSSFQIFAVDARGSLFCWEPDGDRFENFAWETAGRSGAASPVFPIVAWR